MKVEEILEVLKRAQEIDREIYQMRHEIASIPETLQELTRSFEREKMHMSQLEAKLKETQLRQKQKEGELAEKETLIRKYDSQLSQLKTNKEYTTMQQEISSLKADNSILEDEILSILEEGDRVQREFREEKDRLAQAEKETQQKKKELEERERQLQADLKERTAKRSEIIKQVPPEARELYDKIIERKDGLALVPAIGEACGGCRIEIRPQLLNELNLKEALVVCENCSRILFLE